MKALDLFCGAGGVTRGLHRAGFDAVEGVDLMPQPRWLKAFDPLRFVQREALDWFDRVGRHLGYDLLWASPPCQGYTRMRAPGQKGAPRLIAPVREAFVAAERPYCIENVEGAREEMENPILLCGCMFGLGAQGCRLVRRRLFECSFPVIQPACRCPEDPRPVIGIYGGHARRRAASAGGRGTRDVWEGGHRAAASEAMGIDWMTLGEMSEAIPPVYAEYIGLAARAHLLQRHGGE